MPPKVFCIIDHVVEAPQQNGGVERKHKRILNVGRALVYQSKLLASYWSCALSHATFIINRGTSPNLHNKSHYQLHHNKFPDIDSFKVFGSLCYSTTLQAQRSKLSTRARKSVFLGYSVGFKGSVLLDIHFREIHISRHVNFLEHVIPYPTNPSSITTTWNYFSSDSCSTSNPLLGSSPTPSTPIIDPDPPYIEPASPTQPISAPIIRKSPRTINPPSHLQYYICNHVSSPFPALSVNVEYPISDSLSYTNLSPSHCAYSLSIDKC